MQPLLDFDSPPAQRHSPTSVRAAVNIAPAVGTMRAKVLEFIRQHGPISDNRGIKLSGMNPNTYRPRRVELMKAGLIEQAGERDGSVEWKVKLQSA